VLSYGEVEARVSSLSCHLQEDVRQKLSDLGDMIMKCGDV